jgi:hypothetical protein
MIQEYVLAFKHVLEIHIMLYDALPMHLLRQLHLLMSAKDADAEAERDSYVVEFSLHTNAYGHD